MNTPWYEREDIRDQLILFGRAIQGRGPFEVTLESDRAKCRSGYCSFVSGRICVNPTLFSTSPQEQYLLTKALLVHEAGHRRYSSPDILPGPASEIANILEDERVENLMWEEFIGARWLIRRLAVAFHERARSINHTTDSPGEIAVYFLHLRWARRAELSVKGELSAKNHILWKSIEELVYQSWQAENSAMTNRCATSITQRLGLEKSEHPHNENPRKEG